MGLALRHAETRGLPRLPLVRVNYAVAALLAFLAAVATGQTTISRPTALFAVATGALFVAGLLVWLRAMQEAGLAFSVTAMRSAIVVPVLAGAVIWHERPTALELAGGGAAVVALVLVLLDVLRGRDTQRPRRSVAALWLGLLFAVDGLVMAAAQVFRHQLPPTEALPFQAMLFVAAFAVTSVLYFGRPERVDRSTLQLGALVGVANLGNYLFLILALALLPAVAVYPTIAAGEVGLSALAGVFIWRERVSLIGVAGIALAVLALVLVGIGGPG